MQYRELWAQHCTADLWNFFIFYNQNFTLIEHHLPISATSLPLATSPHLSFTAYDVSCK